MPVSPACASVSSTGPSIKVSGVRNSWLTLEKNAVLARSSSARASALTLFLIGSGVADDRGDLPGQQIQEAAIVVVQRAARTNARHQESRQLILAVLADRQDGGRMRRLGIDAIDERTEAALHVRDNLRATRCSHPLQRPQPFRGR